MIIIGGLLYLNFYLYYCYYTCYFIWFLKKKKDFVTVGPGGNVFWLQILEFRAKRKEGDRADFFVASAKWKIWEGGNDMLLLLCNKCGFAISIALLLSFKVKNKFSCVF
jgi:hypothetical protein